MSLYYVRVRLTGPGVIPYWKEMGLLEQQVQLKVDAPGYGAPMWIRRWCRELECAFAGVTCYDRWVDRVAAE